MGFWGLLPKQTKAGYPGRKFRIPAHVLLQLGVEALIVSFLSSRWRQRWPEPQLERRRLHRT